MSTLLQTSLVFLAVAFAAGFVLYRLYRAFLGFAGQRSSCGDCSGCEAKGAGVQVVTLKPSAERLR